MRRTNLGTLAVVTALALLLVSFAMLSGARLWYWLAATSWVEWVASAGLAVMVICLGWQVRSYQKGNRPSLEGIRAARTLALAKAGSLTGAALLGRYGAVVLVTSLNWNYGVWRSQIISAAIASLCALGLLIASLIAERWCELPPPSSESPIGSKLNYRQQTTAYSNSNLCSRAPKATKV